MLKTLVGPEGFRAGTDIYFSRHDGQAVTCEDWVQAIQDANKHVDLSTFRRWYSTSGTPIVSVAVEHDPTAQTLTLRCAQHIPPTSKQPAAEPLLIPLRVGVLDADGKPVPVDLGDGAAPELSRVLLFDKREASFVLRGVPAGSVPSLLRGFSAPVKLVREGGVSVGELAFVMANDTDEFNRWEAAQKLLTDFVLACVAAAAADGADACKQPLSGEVVEAFRKTLVNEGVDAALRAQVLSLPPESYIVEQVEDADPVAIRAALAHLRREMAAALETELWVIVNAGLAERGEYKLDPASQGKRVLKNVALGYLAALGKKETFALCLDIVRTGSNMTDVLAALQCLASSEADERTVALDEFYAKWEHDYLVVDKWLRMQSTAKRDDVLESVVALTQHKAYKETVPNSVYNLIGGFGAANVHMIADGSGYRFLADQVIRLDGLNPQVAARIAKSFTRWRKYEAGRRAQMETELKRIKETEKLSKDVFEVVNNSLSAQ